MNNKRGLLFTFCLIIFCQTSWAQLEPTRSTTFSSDDQNRPLRLEDAFPFYLSVTSPGEARAIDSFHFTRRCTENGPVLWRH